MDLCDGHGLLEFGDTCARTFWITFLPTALLTVLCIRLLPVPSLFQPAFARLTSIFQPFITLCEAEVLDVAGRSTDLDIAETMNFVSKRAADWRLVVFVFVGMAQVLFWVTRGTYNLYTDHRSVWSGVSSFLIASSWFYTVLRPISRPTVTPPFDTCSLYFVLLFSAILQLGGVIFDYSVQGIPLPPPLILFAFIANVIVISLLVAAVFSMPLALPSSTVDSKDIGTSISPEDYTTLWGWISFSWVHPLIRRGRYTTLNEQDVWRLSPTMRSRPLFIKLCSIEESSLLWRLWKANSSDLVLDFALTVVSVIFSYAGPFFLKQILDLINVENPVPEKRARAYIYAFLAFVISIGKAQADAQHLYFGRRSGSRMRTELLALVYDKTLKRKDLSGLVTESSIPSKKNVQQDEVRAGANAGKIVNIVAGDINKTTQVVLTAYTIYAAPLEIIFGGIFLYQLMGWSSFSGFLVLLPGWPLNSLLTHRSVYIQKNMLAARDKRMNVLNELIGAIKFIKFFSWEERWIKRALDAREEEVKWMNRARINTVLIFALWTCAPILISVVSFGVYISCGNQLDIPTAFTAISLFAMIRTPLSVIPSWIVKALQGAVGLKRFSAYLNEEEVTDQVSSLKKDYSEPYLQRMHEEGLGLENASFRWNSTSSAVESKLEVPVNSSGSSTSSMGAESATAAEETNSHLSLEAGNSYRNFELRDLSIKFPEGRLTVIAGPTASGKTALLLAVLGEMTLLSGRIILSKNPSRVDEYGLMHSISYSAQTPWLRNQSIKDNILFGYPYDEDRYKAVLECCALNPDLATLEDGDATEIGAKGVTLSGGQKARVALARAVYARTKYVLLDDPLSAVDSHTSRFLYERLFCGPLLVNRTVVLVTHHIELVLPGAYYIVRMLNGRIEIQGIVSELQAKGILKAIKDDADLSAFKEDIKREHETATLTEETDQTSRKPRKLVLEEHRETGSVKWSIYNTYLQVSSYWTWIILALLMTAVQCLGIAEKLWIKIWGESYDVDVLNTHIPNLYNSSTYYNAPQEGHGTSNKWPSATSHPTYYVAIYAAIGFASGLASVLSVTAQYTGALRASRVLFKQLLVTVVRATFRFHDITPAGRLLNRFGKDIEMIDSSLPSSLQSINTSLAGFFASIITVAVVFPSFLVPALFIGLAYRELAIGYLNTARDLRRMESNAHSPVFSDLGEILEGIVTVRAFSAEQRFLDGFHAKIDLVHTMWYNFWLISRWLLLNYNVLGGLAILVTTVLAIGTLTNDAGLAGLCITSAMAFTSSVFWTCRFWTALELDLNSVERIIEYLNLPQEPPSIIESNRIPAYWPSGTTGSTLISIENLEVRYAPDLPAVLRGISCTLRAGERIGLLGRTGSGKSTFAMSLLRFVDPSNGRIVIDGIDITTIGVNDLRSRVTFIPQDAALFSGSLRDNLDPFDEHTDEECVDVLRRVHMYHSGDDSETASLVTPDVPKQREAISTQDSASTTTDATRVYNKAAVVNLHTQVAVGGTNFSQGQRQLIALARALLRHSAIVVLDEATSSIDFETDMRIQETLRAEFSGSLVLTIAHRLRTVVDYDRLVVLDKGEIIEFDTPSNLINRPRGAFRDMCIQSGSFAELEQTANKVQKLV